MIGSVWRAFIVINLMPKMPVYSNINNLSHVVDREVEASAHTCRQCSWDSNTGI